MQRAARHRRTTPPAGSSIRLLVACVLLVVVVAPASAPGRLLTDQPPVEDSAAEKVFARMTAAWQAGDARAITALVHPDGLSVTSGPNADRRTHYSPSQAYYYFKNLFQSHDTVAFAFDKVQGGGESSRAHGMATWTRRRPGQEREQVIRLMCVLGPADGDWMLTEIHTIR